MAENSTQPIQSLSDKINRHYNRIMKNPTQQAAIWAALAGGATWLAYPWLQDTVTAMAKPFADQAVDQKTSGQLLTSPKHQGVRRGIVTALAAVLAGYTSINVTKQHRLKHGGSWQSFKTVNYQPLKKSASFSSVPGPAMTQLLNTQATMDLFRSDPLLSTYDPYAKNFGTSIIASASNGARNTSLGSIFDSAVDKLQGRMTLSGMANTALNAATSYATASLFTNAVGTMMGLPKGTRDNIISAGTWAGTISSILE